MQHTPPARKIRQAYVIYSVREHLREDTRARQHRITKQRHAEQRSTTQQDLHIALYLTAIVGTRKTLYTGGMIKILRER